MKADAAHARTDKEIEAIDRLLKTVYKRAQREIDAVMINYAESIKSRADGLLKAYKDAKTADEKKAAKKAYILFFFVELKRERKFKTLSESVSSLMYRTNKTATNIINGKMAAVYVDNYNYIGKGIEQHTEGYKLKKVTEEDVQNYGQLEYQKVDKKKDTDWNKKNVSRSVTSQAVTVAAATTIFAVAAKHIVKRNMETALRQASDMMTYAENEGRYDSMCRADDEGFNIKKIWVATLDNRTRDTHIEYDGVGSVELDYEYAPGLRKPRDPDCDDPAEVCNCRCCITYDTGTGLSPTRAAREGTVTGSYKRPSSFTGTHTVRVNRMSYEEWMRWRSR